MDLPTFHPGGAGLGRRPGRPAASAIPVTSPAPPSDVAVRLKGSSMRVMEASLAIVALATAVLLGLGR